MQEKRIFSMLMLLHLRVLSKAKCFDSEGGYLVPSATTVPKVPLTGSSGPFKQRSLHGEPCNKHTKCKSGSWLTCDLADSQCHCTKPDEMIWDDGASKCVVLIREVCRFKIAGPEGDGNQLFETADCVENAVCNAGTCGCLSTYYGNEDGSKCCSKKDHGNQCTSNEECNEFKRLMCNNSSCTCKDPLTMVVDPKDGICRVKIGSGCTSFPNACFDNATCLEGAISFKTCTCPDGYYSTLDNMTCLPLGKKDSNCTKDVECDDKNRLSCVNNKCSCDPHVSVENMEQFETLLINEYDRPHNVPVPLGVCLSKVGRNCTKYKPSPSHGGWGVIRPSTYGNEVYCIKRAVCNQNRATCECGYRMMETGKNMCGNVHGTACGQSNPCADTLICHYDRSKDQGICKCPSPSQQVYDSASKECRGKPGAACSPEQPSCIPNALCVKLKGTHYHCKCNAGFVERESSRDCDIEYGHQCNQTSSTTPCDEQAGLHCIHHYNGTMACLCPDAEQVYEPLRRKCSSGVGRSCMKNEDCVLNANCIVAEASTGLRCACGDGFEETEDLTCTKEEATLPLIDINDNGTHVAMV